MSQRRRKRVGRKGRKEGERGRTAVDDTGKGVASSGNSREALRAAEEGKSKSIFEERGSKNEPSRRSTWSQWLGAGCR
jgi:hypothetical protein